MYNVIGTQIYVGWHDGKYIPVNHHYRLAEYEVAFLSSDPSQIHLGPLPKFSCAIDFADDFVNQNGFNGN
jgi:hypothetical protein